MSAASKRRVVLRGLPLLLIALTACEQVIRPDLPEHTPRLVLQAFFTADSTWTAYVGRSVGILETLPPSEQAVAGATVELLEGDRVVGELRFLDRSEVYVLDDNPLEAGRSYSLRVSAPGFATIRATDTIPGPVAASADTHVAGTRSAREDSLARNRFPYSIQVEIQDPPGETNYYQISVHYYDGPVRREFSFSTRDPSIMGASDSEESPFEEEGWHGSAPFFKDTLFDGQTHEIELTEVYQRGFPSQPSTVSAYRNKLFVQVLHISEDYYEYHKTALLHEETRENPFAEPLGVHGNVENGYGIFAGYSSRTFEFDLESYFEQDFDFEE